MWIGMGWISNSGGDGRGRLPDGVEAISCRPCAPMAGAVAIRWDGNLQPSPPKGPRLFSDEARLSTRATAGGLVDRCDGQGSEHQSQWETVVGRWAGGGGKGEASVHAASGRGGV